MKIIKNTVVAAICLGFGGSAALAQQTVEEALQEAEDAKSDAVAERETEFSLYQDAVNAYTQTDAFYHQVFVPIINNGNTVQAVEDALADAEDSLEARDAAVEEAWNAFVAGNVDLGNAYGHYQLGEWQQCIDDANDATNEFIASMGFYSAGSAHDEDCLAHVAVAQDIMDSY